MATYCTISELNSTRVSSRAVGLGVACLRTGVSTGITDTCRRYPSLVKEPASKAVYSHTGASVQIRATAYCRRLQNLLDNHYVFKPRGYTSCMDNQIPDSEVKQMPNIRDVLEQTDLTSVRFGCEVQ